MNIALLNIFLTVLNFFRSLFVYVYIFAHFIYEFNIVPILRQNILRKINYVKIAYLGILIKFHV